MTCDAKIRPFSGTPNGAVEIVCQRDDDHDEHAGLLRDYAYPGSESIIHWFENDRRTFRGDWADCRGASTCILPDGHRGDHAF